jgi:hypothetical protein
MDKREEREEKKETNYELRRVSIEKSNCKDWIMNRKNGEKERKKES